MNIPPNDNHSQDSGASGLDHDSALLFDLEDNIGESISTNSVEPMRNLPADFQLEHDQQLLIIREGHVNIENSPPVVQACLIHPASSFSDGENCSYSPPAVQHDPEQIELYKHLRATSRLPTTSQQLPCTSNSTINSTSQLKTKTAKRNQTELSKPQPERSNSIEDPIGIEFENKPKYKFRVHFVPPSVKNPDGAILRNRMEPDVFPPSMFMASVLILFFIVGPALICISKVSPEGIESPPESPKFTGVFLPTENGDDERLAPTLLATGVTLIVVGVSGVLLQICINLLLAKKKKSTKGSAFQMLSR